MKTTNSGQTQAEIRLLFPQLHKGPTPEQIGALMKSVNDFEENLRRAEEELAMEEDRNQRVVSVEEANAWARRIWGAATA